MAKSKHIEVKPSKFKTSLCQYFINQRECPFGTRCVFAHGKAELQVEQDNIELMRASGVQRLNELFSGGSAGETSSESNVSTPNTSNTGCDRSDPSTPRCDFDLVHVKLHATRRRAILVSLPKRGTGSEMHMSPYASEHHNHSYSSQDGIYFHRTTTCRGSTEESISASGVADSLNERAGVSSGNTSASRLSQQSVQSDNTLNAQLGSFVGQKAQCKQLFLSTCRNERPLIYRHNPYCLY